MSCSMSLLSSSSIPKTGASIKVCNQRCTVSVSVACGVFEKKKRASLRMKAGGLTEIEPDLNEDPIDRWATNSVDEDEFEYGIYDGHHTYFEAENKADFWGKLKMEYESVDPPTGFQGLISWLFLPAIGAGMYFQVPGEYLFIGAGIFTIVFCIIEMDKPDKPHNFEPRIYNLDRGIRDKLIADYNSMNIWEFNEKYGDFWDITIKKDKLTKPDL